MSPILRIMLVVATFLFVALVFRTVNKRKLQMKYSLVWISMSLIILIVAVFPQIAVSLSALIGIEVPSNFVYLLGIIVLMVISFNTTVILSKQSEEIKKIIQTVSIDKYLQKEEQDEQE